MPYNSLLSRTDVSALIPEDVSNQVLEGAIGQSAALALFPTFRMSAAQQRMPALSALPLAYFVNGDTGLKQTTDMAWENNYLNVEELAAIVPIPDAVLEDASFDVWGEVRPRLEEAIGRALDAAIFFGTNKPASWPTAIVTAAVAAGNTLNEGTAAAAAGGYADDISDLFALVESDGYDVNGIIANRVWRGRLRSGVRSTTGEIAPEVSPAGAFGVDIAYPMRGLWPALTTGNTTMIAGDFSRGIIGIRRDITYKLLDQAVITDAGGLVQFNLPQQDMVAMRVTFRVAWTVANPLNHDQPTEANRYPFGVLRVT